MSDKIKIIVSDLHLGAGRAEEGNSLEDFASDAEFSDLLRALVVESEREQREVELILAGDVLEFLQTPALEDASTYDPTAQYAAEQYASSSEAASIAKLTLMMAGHPRFFAALRAFVQSAPPYRRLTWIKGNHDVNLHWLGVQEALRAALGATGPRAACVTFEERRISREGIYVEHGNQYAERVNRFPDFEEPHDSENPDQLYLPPGSAFVLNFFNTLEHKHYWMDGVKPITALIWYTFALDFDLAVRALFALLRELPSLVWGGLPVERAVTAYLETHEHLLEEIEDPRRIQAVQRDLGQMSDFYRRVAFALALYGAPGRSAEMALVEGARDYTVLPRALAEEKAQRLALERIAAQKAAQERARVIVFGHTHAAVALELAEGAVYINSGSWTWTRDFAGEDFATWKRLFKDPASFTNQRRLSYVRVDYDSQGQPSARLLTFRRDESRREPIWRSVLRRLLGKRRP